jgi:diguanylate cyclase (GGDEF)-like protein/PAS domain S-box-containing protein
LVKMYLASLKLAVALVCVGASVILGAHWFGFLPDTKPIEMRAREMLSESIAVNAAAHVRKHQWVDLKTTLQTQVDRNPDLLSVGIRSGLGALRAQTGHHDEIWPQDVADTSHVYALEVPITLNRRPWGNVELCYRQPHPDTLSRIIDFPIVRLLAFFTVCGIFAYTLFVVRILGLFNGTQVVPDRVRGALDTLAEGLLVLDEKGRIVLANQAFANIVGKTPEALADKPASDLAWVEEELEDGVYPWDLAIRESEMQTQRKLRFKVENGRHRIFSVNAAPLGKDRSQRGALATFRDVTHVEEHRAELENMLGLLRSSQDEIKRKNKELEVLATRDALTGCLNRRAFFEQMERVWIEAQTNGTPLACLMIDIDHFKNVNDTYGHHTGDEVLRHTSQAIRQIFKDKGTVCRYGGEEFCVFLPHFDLEQAFAEAEQARVAITEIRLDHPAELRLAGSLGVSETRFDAASPQDLINQADRCLYAAKREGRNRVVGYNASMAHDPEEIEEALEAKERGRIDISSQAVTALVSTLTYRDAHTAQHSRRVADLCVRAAEGLLDATQTYVLEVAALLHDIGKIGVPDEVLLKPGPLTQDERDLIARHDRIGGEIIATAFECQPLSEIISLHHTFFDGTGEEPHTPIGEELPLGARMLSIADGYDAMVTDRVYRKGCSHDDAIAELRRCAGTQFDPVLVEHFANRVASAIPTMTNGALAIQKQTAIQIGYEVERIANAVAEQDIASIKTLVGRLGLVARNADIEAIVSAAEKIEAEACQDDLQWMKLLRDTQDLLDVCRSTQVDILKNALAFGEHNFIS